MATAVMAGIAAYGALAGTTIAVNTAIALSVAAAAAAAIAEKAMAPDAPDQTTSVESNAQQIDKTALQQEGKVGELQLGATAKEKAERKRGKAAFKIELDKKDQEVQPSESGGVQVKKSDLGVQL